MPKDGSRIDAVRIMKNAILGNVQTYRICMKETGMTNKTMEDLEKFVQQLEEELSRLEKS